MFAYGAANAVSGASGIVLLVLLSRLLSPSGYGLFSTATALVGFFQIAGFYWILTSILRFGGSLGEGERAKLWSATRWGYAIVCGAFSLVWLLAILLLMPAKHDFAIWAVSLLALLLRGWVSVLQVWNRMLGKLWLYLWTEIAQTGGTIAAVFVGLAVLPGQPVAALAATAAASLLAALIPRNWGFKDAPRSLDRELLASMLRYGIPGALVPIGFSGLFASERLVIIGLLGLAAAGAYSAAFGIAERSIGLLFTSVSIGFKPLVFTHFEQDNPAAASGLLRRHAVLLMALGIPVLSLLVFAPDVVALVLIGSELAEPAAELLPWVALGGFLSKFAVLHFGTAYQISRRTARMLVGLIPAAGTILFMALLLPRYGIVAAGWANAAAFTLAAILIVILSRAHYPIPFPARDAFRTIAACIPLWMLFQVRVSSSIFSLAILVSGTGFLYGLSALMFDVAGTRTMLAAKLRRKPSGNR